MCNNSKIPTDFLDSPFLVKEVHGLLHLVVGGYSEWDDLHRGQTWGHGEDFATVCGFIQVLLGHWVRHACRVPAHNVEVCPSDHPGSAVPLDLRAHRETSRFKSKCNCLTTVVSDGKKQSEKEARTQQSCTSVGPAYIMGDGKMATMVCSGSRTPSSRTAACCFMRQSSGTSSSLVQPPRGCRRRTGFL